MGIGVSILLIAAGAILRWGITENSTSGVNLDAIGLILLVVGVIGLVVSLLWATIGSRGRSEPRPVVRDRDVY